MDVRHQRTERLARARHGVLSRADLFALGWTRGQIQHRIACGEWRTLLVGTVLVDPALALSCTAWADLPLLTRLSAARAYHGDETIAVSVTAARLHGLDPPVVDDGVVHVRLPPGRERHQQTGVRLHTLLLGSEECEVVDGFRVTSLARTVIDCVLTLPRDPAIAMLDALLRTHRFDRSGLHALRDAARGRRRVRRTWEWWDLANPGGQSPLESRLRLIASDAGLAPDHLQYPVLSDDGRLLGYGDMAWELLGGCVLVAEADGAAVHDRPSALYRDRRRANDFLATGRVEMVRFTWADTRSPSYVVSVIRQRLRGRWSRRS